MHHEGSLKGVSCGVLFPAHLSWIVIPRLFLPSKSFPGSSQPRRRLDRRHPSTSLVQRCSSGAAQGIQPPQQQRGIYKSAVIPSPASEGETACFTRVKLSVSRARLALRHKRHHNGLIRPRRCRRRSKANFWILPSESSCPAGARGSPRALCGLVRLSRGALQ